MRAARPALAVALALVTGAAAAQPLPAGFVHLRDVDPTIAQDMRYATANNFTGHSLPGYDAGACILQRAAALALKRAQADLAKENLSLKVYDCYRPTRAVAAMARWAADPHATPDTRRFYPGLRKGRLFALGYIASHSAHSRGVAVDLTLVPQGAQHAAAFDASARYGSCAGPASERAPDDSLDMGTSFDCFSTKSYTRAGGLTVEQRQRRDRLVRAMARHGFVNYKREWWHFSYPAADPRREYDFPVR
ncbi:MAG TPA: M15 family metallopeptidase [Pseudolabrys sp.]|uniref:M15 family metallopeptidase n=1 Tax=Pseudolabrys sp. TaxID=1960880 RepID=UPI002DDCCB52|nr:M15 family metallopeptidase [Pseudolabrys sp.]HEV2630369.1 M15 family metallopeptidase [Pseudolabrys sp.]